MPTRACNAARRRSVFGKSFSSKIAAGDPPDTGAYCSTDAHSGRPSDHDEMEPLQKLCALQALIAYLLFLRTAQYSTPEGDHGEFWASLSISCPRGHRVRMSSWSQVPGMRGLPAMLPTNCQHACVPSRVLHLRIVKKPGSTRRPQSHGLYQGIAGLVPSWDVRVVLAATVSA